MKNSKLFLTGLLVMLLGYANNIFAGDDLNKILIRKWNISEMTLDKPRPGSALPPEAESIAKQTREKYEAEKAKTYFNFDGNKFEMNLGSFIDKGTWTVSDDNKTLLLKPAEAPAVFRMTIVSAESGKVILKYEEVQFGQNMTLTLVPFPVIAPSAK